MCQHVSVSAGDSVEEFEQVQINTIWKIKSQPYENLRVLVLETELERINRFLSAGLFYKSRNMCLYIAYIQG